MARQNDLVGKQFGRLTVIQLNDTKRPARPTWLCICICGNQTSVATTLLARGRTNSCGCLQKEVAANRLTTHGQTANGHRSSEHQTWARMLQRCNNPLIHNFHNYGGRGITVCDRWLSFENFLADMGRKPSKSHSIDRRDNNGNYEPDNCHWATTDEQSANRSNNRRITFADETLTLTKWAKRLNISPTTLTERIEKWPLEKALTTMSLKDEKLTHNGMSMTRKEWSVYLGVAHSTIRARVNTLPLSEALEKALIRKSPMKKHS